MISKTAGELMIPLDKYPHIPYWFTIRQAIAEIHHGELSVGKKRSLPRAVLVFDEEYRLLGIVRRRDIMRALEPKLMLGKANSNQKKLFDMEVDPNLLELTEDRFELLVEKKSELAVSEIMLPIDITLDISDHLTKIIYELCEYKHALIPVMKDKTVVGVVRTVEVMSEISAMLKIT